MTCAQPTSNGGQTIVPLRRIKRVRKSRKPIKGDGKRKRRNTLKKPVVGHGRKKRRTTQKR